MREPISDVVLGEFALLDEIERYPPGDGASGRRAETLVKNDELRVVLITMRAGAALQEHTAPGPITIQTLRGRFAVDVEGSERELGIGGLIAIATGAPHAVRALEDGGFLLTIGWSPTAKPRPGMPIDD
jgi:quercetin dioxygenase-like cupin family protein